MGYTSYVLMIVVSHDCDQVLLLPKLDLLPLCDVWSAMWRIREVGPAQDPRDGIQVRGCCWRSSSSRGGVNITVADTRVCIAVGIATTTPCLEILQVVARLEDEGLAVQVLVQVLPQHQRVLTQAALVDGRLVVHARRLGRALEVEHPVDGLPWSHAAEPFEDGAGSLKIVGRDERGEEELVHGSEWFGG